MTNLSIESQVTLDLLKQRKDREQRDFLLGPPTNTTFYADKKIADTYLELVQAGLVTETRITHQTSRYNLIERTNDHA